MTTFERFERAIPELMTELSPARVPDYFDDMLQQTAATRQRPAWSSLERWIPDGCHRPVRPAAPIPVATAGRPRAPWTAHRRGPRGIRRLTAAACRRRYGLARNGQVVFATGDGDIAAVDPATGTIMQLITGPTQDEAPWFSPDGRQFVFVRTVPRWRGLFRRRRGRIRRRQLVAPQVEWFEWSPGSDRIVVRQEVRGEGVVSVVDVESGTSTRLDLGLDIQQPMWRPNHDQIVFASESSSERRFYLVDPDGTDLRMIDTARGVVNLPSLLAGWRFDRVRHLGAQAWPSRQRPDPRRRHRRRCRP